MKNAKNIIPVITSIIISYLLNCYYFNTFDSSKFPTDAKITTTCLLIFAVFIYIGVMNLNYGDQAEEIKKLKAQIKIQSEDCKHDWQPHKYSSLSEMCIKCQAERGKN